MDREKILSAVDHTLLGQTATWEDIKVILDDSIKYNAASACIPAYYVKPAKEYVGDKLPICTVIGFPNGYSTTATKVFETKDAIEKGAQEIDMVINIAMLKDKEYDYVENEIHQIVEAAKDKAIVKVIIETCLLTDEEKIKACELSQKAGADFVKTSTGFSTGGATVHDIALMRKTVGAEMGVKASGGVHTHEEALAMVEAGATRIGASAGVKLLK